MNFKFKLSRRLAIALLLSLGCKLTAAGPVVDRVESVQVTPPRFTLVPSQSAHLLVFAITSHGDTGEAAVLQWATTGGGVGNNGTVGGVHYLTYTAPATPGDYLFTVSTQTGWPADTARFAVTATPVSLNAITVAPGALSLALNDTATFAVALWDSTGAVLLGRQIDWESSDPSVATVLVTGFVRGMAAGSTTITATSEGHFASAVVTVNPAP